MAFASITYTSASGTTFALTNSDGNAIEYLRQNDISVTVNGTLQTVTTDYMPCPRAIRSLVYSTALRPASCCSGVRSPMLRLFLERVTARRARSRLNISGCG